MVMARWKKKAKLGAARRQKVRDAVEANGTVTRRTPRVDVLE